MRAKAEYPTRHGDQHLADGSDPIPGFGLRHVYGRISDDATTLQAGSGDWEAVFTGGGIEITIDPPFDTSFAFNVTPNDNGDGPFMAAPDLVQGSGLSYSGFVMGYQVDLATVVIFFWDLDGNTVGPTNRCGFDFTAVGT